MAYALAGRLERAVKNSGLKYKKVAGFASRGHGTMGTIQTIVPHHTAGPKSGNTPSLNVVTNGRPGLSGPLAQIFLARDGTVYLCAAGISYHAGRVRSNSYANSHSIGIEAENTGLSNDPWPSHQMDAYAKLCKALCKEFGLSTSRVLGHKEVCSPAGRKSDPSFNMPAFRKKVGGAKGGVGSDLGSSGGGSSTSYKTVNYGTTLGLYDKGQPVGDWQRFLKLKGYNLGSGGPKKDGVDEAFGPTVDKATRDWQGKNKLKADGLVGDTSWTLAKKQGLKSTNKKSTPAPKKKASGLKLTGKMDKATKVALQKDLGVKADGIIGKASIKALQKRIGAAPDSIWGRDTTGKLQNRLGVKVDKVMGPVTITALQKRLNKGRL